MMLGGFNYRCLVTALPPFLIGTALGEAGLAKGSLFVWVALVVGGAGQYLGGWLAGRHGSRLVYLFLVVLLAPLALLLGGNEGSAWAAFAAGGLAVCLFALQPIENLILADWTSADRRSLSYATKFAFTFGLGALGAPVVGFIWERFGSLAPAFYVLAGSAVLMTGLAFAAMHILRSTQPSVSSGTPSEGDSLTRA